MIPERGGLIDRQNDTPPPNWGGGCNDRGGRVAFVALNTGGGCSTLHKCLTLILSIMNNYSLTNELKKYINEVRETSITDEQSKMYKDAVLFLDTLEIDESTKENLKCILFSVIDLKITLGYFL